MDADTVLDEIQDINLTYLLLAQRMLKEDFATALFRLKIDPAMAEVLTSLSARQLGSWIEQFEIGSNWILKLVGVFYKIDFSFGQFLRKYPGHRGNLTDLLIGRIFHDEAGRIFDDLDLEVRD